MNHKISRLSLIIACHLVGLSLLISLNAQVKKIENIKALGAVEETYFVLESDSKIKEGLYTEKYRGITITKGKYEENKRIGLWKFKDFQGKFEMVGIFVNGEKNGKWICKDEHRIRSEIYYSNGKIDSLFSCYEDGQPERILRHDSNGDGIDSIYYEDGQLELVVHKKNYCRDGLHLYYFKNGQLSTESIYKDGKINTAISAFDFEGNPLDPGTLKDGNGTHILYLIPEESSKKNTKKSSKKESKNKSIGFTKNQVRQYSNGDLDGPYEAYYDNGKIHIKGQLKNGFKDGTWNYYTETEQFSRTEEFNYLDEIALEYKTIDGIPPFFQGGEREMMKFIYYNIVYPPNAKKNNIDGMAVCNFITNEFGEISDLKIVRSISDDIDQEVFKIVHEMPRWNPAIQYGLPVCISYNLPVRFKLE